MTQQGTEPQVRMSSMIKQSFAALTPVERIRVIGMYASILALHALGFFIFIAFVVPAHYKGLAFGVAVTAYTLGSPARWRSATSSPLAIPPSWSRSGWA